MSTTRARIATVCQAGRLYASVEQNREHVLRILDLALRQQPDLVCLPEAFTTTSVPAASAATLAEPVPGPTTDAVAHRARKHRRYVICPIRYDFNYRIADEIMATYPGRVEIRPHRDDDHILFEPLDDRLTTEQLRAEFGIESTLQYHQRHRQAYQQLHQGQLPRPQRAAHGERRPMYAKE